MCHKRNWRKCIQPLQEILTVVVEAKLNKHCDNNCRKVRPALLNLYLSPSSSSRMVSESCGNPSVEVEAIMSRMLLDFCATYSWTKSLKLGRPKYDKSKICIKCKVNNGAIVVRHAVYCKYDFLRRTYSR